MPNSYVNNVMRFFKLLCHRFGYCVCMRKCRVSIPDLFYDCTLWSWLKVPVSGE